MAAFIERHLRGLVVEALQDTRVVVVVGARQVGKSTLVQQIAATDHTADVITLDDRGLRSSALDDPVGFVAELGVPVVIDEVQRAPEVLLAIKERVDRDPTPGQFLLTGSANLLTAPSIADTLTGRAEYYRLWPFTQGELVNSREAFIPALFAGRFPRPRDAPVGRGAFAPMLAAGGFPEARKRAARGRERFFDGYLDTVLDRDLASIATVHEGANVRRLLAALAATSASLLNVDGLSRDLGIAASTLRPHLDLLEMLFLTRRIPSWQNNRLSRVIKAPKAYVTDSGLLCHLLGVDAGRIATDPNVAGPLVETFVAMELLRQAAWQDPSLSIFHYRDKEKREIDVVLERRDGSVVAIEVKAAASVGSSDLRALRHLRDALGDRFLAGALVYLGRDTVPFGERLAAVPLPGLWAPDEPQ